MADAEYLFSEGRASGCGAGATTCWMEREEIIENSFVVLQMHSKTGSEKSKPYVMIPGYVAAQPMRDEYNLRVPVDFVRDFREQKRIKGIARHHGFEGPVAFWNEKTGKDIVTIDKLVEKKS